MHAHGESDVLRRQAHREQSGWSPFALLLVSRCPRDTSRPNTWRGVRVVDGATLEMLCTARYRGFESRPLRKLFVREDLRRVNKARIVREIPKCFTLRG